MIDNILFIGKVLNNKLSPIIKSWFQFCYNIQRYCTVFSMKSHLHKNSFRTINFGKFSVNVRTIGSWNKIQDKMGEMALKYLRPSKNKWLLTNNILTLYFIIFIYIYIYINYLLTYLLTYLRAYLFTYLLTYLLT